MTIKVTPPTPGSAPDITGSQKLKTGKRLTDPGPEEFHEIAIDVPNPEKRSTITFDIEDEDSIGDSFKKKLADMDEDIPKAAYEKTKMEKFLNILLCRRDLVDQKLSEKPVSFWDLVS